jgi:hypothetical protein
MSNSVLVRTASRRSRRPSPDGASRSRSPLSSPVSNSSFAHISSLLSLEELADPEHRPAKPPHASRSGSAECRSQAFAASCGQTESLDSEEILSPTTTATFAAGWSDDEGESRFSHRSVSSSSIAEGARSPEHPGSRKSMLFFPSFHVAYIVRQVILFTTISLVKRLERALLQRFGLPSMFQHVSRNVSS